MSHGGVAFGCQEVICYLPMDGRRETQMPWALWAKGTLWPQEEKFRLLLLRKQWTPWIQQEDLDVILVLPRVISSIQVSGLLSLAVQLSLDLSLSFMPSLHPMPRSSRSREDASKPWQFAYLRWKSQGIDLQVLLVLHRPKKGQMFCTKKDNNWKKWRKEWWVRNQVWAHSL